MVAPTPDWGQLVPVPKPDPAVVREHARLNAALLAGWTIRYDVELDEYFAARQMHKGRSLGQLLDKIEGLPDGS